MDGIAIRVADLGATERVLRDAQVRFERAAGGLDVDPSEAFGVAIRFHG